MYGQGGSFNPHYHHGAPPPPQQQAGVSGSFPQQPVPRPPPQQQAGVVAGSFPQQPVPRPPAPYPQQHPGLRPPPPGPYQHGVGGVRPPQNQPYPYAQHGQMHQMPMLPQQRGYAPMPMPGMLPPQQAMHQAPPQYTNLPPPPPRPSAPPPPSPPPPPPPPPASQGASDGGHFTKTLETAPQLIVSDDSDMDMEDEDSPSRQPLTPENSSLVTAECTGNVNVSKSISDVSSPGKDLSPGSGENAKTANATEDGGSAIRLIEGYASDESANEADAGPEGASTLVNTPHGTEQNGKAKNYHLKDESNPVKHGADVLGHLAKEDHSISDIILSDDSEFDGRRQKKRTRSKSPQSRSGSPVGANKSSPSQTSSPVKQTKPPFAKRFHPAGDGNDSGGRVVQQESPALTSKLDSSSNDLIGKVGDNATLDVALGQNCHSDNLISEHSQPVAASADTHKMQRPCPPLESRSDLNVPSSAGDPIPMSQPAAGVPYMSVQTTKSSMTFDNLQPHPQSLCPPEHMSSSNMTQLPGQPSFPTSEFPQMQFQHKVIVPANKLLQNQTRSYPPQDVSHRRPFDFHHHALPPVIPSNQQPSTIPVENAPVPHPDRWSEYSGGVGLSYSSQPPYGQHQPPGNLDSGSNLVYPSFQRFPSNLPGSNNLGPLPDVDLTKSSIKPHYNPFASTFDKTDPSLDIEAPVSPNAIGSVSTTAEPVSSKQKLFRQEFASGAPYDPLLDSIEPSSSSINKVRKEKNWSAADSSDASKLMNLEVDSENMYGLGVVAESEVEGLGEVAADTEAGVVENASPEFLGAKDWNSDIPGDVDNDQALDKNKKGTDSRSLKLFKIAIADFVKEILKPSWRQGNMSKEAYKTIVRKTVDKVSNSVPSSHIPKTHAKMKHYVQSSQKKVTKLVMGYVDKYVKP